MRTNSNLVEEAKRQVLADYSRDNVVFRHPTLGGAIVIHRKLFDELGKDYGPRHTCWVQQLRDKGWVETDEDPANLVYAWGRVKRKKNGDKYVEVHLTEK